MNATQIERMPVSVKARLLNLSKERGEDYNLILTRYALERFLYRLSHSPYKNEFILKGAMVFQLWGASPHRATRDLDLLAEGDVDSDVITKKITTICNTVVAEDGLEFDLSGFTVNDIRVEDRYGGKRVKFLGLLGSTRIPIQIDIGIGDAVTPSPIESQYPTLLNMDLPHVLAYPRETVVAEKLEAIIDLGMNNSRMKDFFDLWFIFTTFQDDLNMLAQAVQKTFARRGQLIPQDVPIGLSDQFANDPQKQAQWKAFLKYTIGGEVSLDTVINIIRDIAMKIFAFV
jgi:predicted nucleotidyltransferase component of viral defense system